LATETFAIVTHNSAAPVLAKDNLRKVSLWLGHAHVQTTEIYTRADPSVKLEVLQAVMPQTLRSGRFKGTEKLIASLTARSVMRSDMPTP
jgi:integrase/recombinase XerD